MRHGATRPKSADGELERFEPVTGDGSVRVMQRAERYDNVRIAATVSTFGGAGSVPERATVVDRSAAHFGPRLLLRAGDEKYLLTAPGPDTHLLLWETVDEGRAVPTGWRKLAEVRVRFADEQPRID